MQSSGHEQEILMSIHTAQNDLKRLGNNVDKLSDLYLEQIQTNNHLINKLNLLEQSFTRNQLVTEEIIKIIKEGINNKESLINQVSDNKRNLELLLEQIKQEKIDAKEKIRVQQEETLMLIQEQNNKFNKKIAIISTVAAIATVIVTVIALFK